MRIEPVIVLGVAAVAALWPFVHSQSLDKPGGARYQAIGYGLLLAAAIVGVILEPGPLRFAYLVLALAMAVRLALVLRQARKRPAQPEVAPGTPE